MIPELPAKMIAHLRHSRGVLHCGISTYDSNRVRSVRQEAAELHKFAVRIHRDQSLRGNERNNVFSVLEQNRIGEYKRGVGTRVSQFNQRLIYLTAAHLNCRDRQAGCLSRLLDGAHTNCGICRIRHYAEPVQVGDLSMNQVGRHRRQAINLVFCPAVFDRYIVGPRHSRLPSDLGGTPPP